MKGISNKELFIKRKLSKLDKKIKKLKKRKKVDNICYSIIGGFSIASSLGLFALTSSLVCSAALLIVLPINVALVASKSNKLANFKIKKLNNNKQHLNSLFQSNLKDSVTLNKKRKAKIKDLIKEKEIQENKSYNFIGKSILGASIEAIGLGLSITTPFSAIPLALGLIVINNSLDSYLKCAKKQSELSTRISNLKNDLDIIDVQKNISLPKKKKSKIKVSKKEYSKNRAKDNSYIPIQIYSKDAIKQNEEAIDKYLKSLEVERRINKQKCRVRY